MGQWQWQWHDCTCHRASGAHTAAACGTFRGVTAGRPVLGSADDVRRSAAGARDRIFHIEHRYFEVQSFHVDSDNPPHPF